ncbi:MAG: hypothetical protein FWG63_06290 [Defluviitaleaceae bacterium]|nr:hypothetical protein [Defluviitaleaceae bacterium]
MAISNAQKKTVSNYKKKSYGRIETSVSKGKKETLKAHATNQDEALARDTIILKNTNNTAWRKFLNDLDKTGNDESLLEIERIKIRELNL